MLDNKRIYYEHRSQQARALAAAAKNSKVAAVHLEMAERYERLASARQSERQFTFDAPLPTERHYCGQ